MKQPRKHPNMISVKLEDTPKDYKQEALELWRASGCSAAKLEAELGIRPLTTTQRHGTLPTVQWNFLSPCCTGKRMKIPAVVLAAFLLGLPVLGYMPVDPSLRPGRSSHHTSSGQRNPRGAPVHARNAIPVTPGPKSTSLSPRALSWSSRWIQRSSCRATHSSPSSTRATSR